MIRRVLSIVLCLVVSLQGADLKQFVATHCLDCHDDETRKGKLSLESFGDKVDGANAADWLKALQQIERGTMPPPDKKQPAPEDRRDAILSLETKLVDHARALPDKRPTMLRRLSRTEYRETIRDLLHLDVSTDDPTREFPEDTRVHGFPSNGEKLVTSSFLLRQYLRAAQEIIGRAVHFEPKPATQHWDLLPPFDRTTPAYLASERAYWEKAKKQPQPHQNLLERPGDSPRVGYHPIDALREGVAVSGWYRVRIRAEAKFRTADLDPQKMRFPLGPPNAWGPSEPLRLSLSSATLQGIDPENAQVRDFAATHQQAGERHLATWDVPDDEATWLECRVWLDRGHFPRLTFPNGVFPGNYRLNSYFNDNKYTLLTKDQLASFEEDQKRGDGFNIPMWFESPRIRLHQMTIDGPLNEEWPPASHRALFGDAPYRSEDAGEILHRFAMRAWRRPAQPQEIAPFLELVRSAEKLGHSPEAAIQQGFQAILCSPDFLYREERNENLSGNEIASRLSYFLWSSMPDEQLQKLATTPDLSQPAARRAQAERLLADSRSDTFINEFLNGWIALRKLGTMAPDAAKFRVYYSDDLEPAMRTETRLFFRHLLHSNGSISQFLDSDYTFINRELAKLYGIDPKEVEKGRGQPVEGLRPQDLDPSAGGKAPSIGFAKVKLTDPRRGGLLGQASVLTLSANGVDTSPVIRGIWVLENILGAPPSPPPPNVPTIEPDIRGATTIRDQLQKHRENASCKSCHRVIDPPGFALESFDAIGQWRGHYLKNNVATPIDSSGDFNGTPFRDITGFKKELLKHQEQFARCMVEKLLIHLLGRELEIADRPAIRKIVETAAPAGYRLRDLILLCCESDLICHK